MEAISKSSTTNPEMERMLLNEEEIAQDFYFLHSLSLTLRKQD
jgi:hypothetical protein